MAKDPAVLFYSKDFFDGVALLNWEERGKYITILCQMHQKGHLSEESIRFLVGSVSDNLRLKFSVDSVGLWYSKRLDIEVEKRKNFVTSRQENGKLGGRPTSKKQVKKPKSNLNETDRFEVGYPKDNLPVNANVIGNGDSKLEMETGNAKTLHVQIRELFTIEYKRATGLTYTWGGIDGKKTNELIAKLKTTLSGKIDGYTEQDIYQTFEIFITRLPDWYRKNGFDLKTIVSNYDKIMGQLNIKHNGLNIQQFEDDSERFIRAHEYGERLKRESNNSKPS